MVLIIHPMQQFSRCAKSGTVILLANPRLRVTLLTYSEWNGLGQIQAMWSAHSQSGYFGHQ